MSSGKKQVFVCPACKNVWDLEKGNICPKCGTPGLEAVITVAEEEVVEEIPTEEEVPKKKPKGKES